MSKRETREERIARLEAEEKAEWLAREDRRERLAPLHDAGFTDEQVEALVRVFGEPS